MTVVPLGPEAGTAVLRALRANEVVCLLSDRDIQGGGVEVDFFGERTTLPAGPAILGLRTGAPVVPTAVYFADRPRGPPRRHPPAARPPTATARCATTCCASRSSWRPSSRLLIRGAPEQWHLFQPNWPSDPGYGE